MKSLIVFICVILCGCARTTVSYNPATGEVKYSSTKDVSASYNKVKTAAGDEQLQWTVSGDASTVESARGRSVSGYIDASGRLVIDAAQLAAKGAVP